MDNTYNKLITSGIKLFGDYGFDTVSVRDIVADSGVNISAVSYHFGGKHELYQAVVNHLAHEVKVRLSELDTAKFAQLSLPEMEQRLAEIIVEFQELFLSRNGISRLNIFTREISSPDKNNTHQYFIIMIESVHNFFQSILHAYYSKRNENTDKIEFIIGLLITTLKSSTLQKSEPLCAKYQQPDMLERLTKLVLYSQI
jgi:AcrR family transcriptional regulator